MLFGVIGANVTLIVNLFGGPGTGKSTISADIFSRLKKLGVQVELVQEYMKELIWEQRNSTFDDQLYISAKQHRRISRLVGKVDVIVTDSPLPLGAFYCTLAQIKYAEQLSQLIYSIHSQYNNYNILLERQFTHIQLGRIHTHEESVVIDDKIREWLNSTNTPYIQLDDPAKLEEVITEICQLIQQN